MSRSGRGAPTRPPHVAFLVASLIQGHCAHVAMATVLVAIQRCSDAARYVVYRDGLGERALSRRVQAGLRAHRRQELGRLLAPAMRQRPAFLSVSAARAPALEPQKPREKEKE